MVVNPGYQYKILAAIVAVAGLLFYLAMYKYSDSPEILVSEPETGRSGEEDTSPDESLSSARPSDHSVIGDDYSRSRQEMDAQKARVSIDVNNGLILVDVVEATLHDVLAGLADKALVVVVDLGPENESVSEEAQPAKQSFRFSGAVDDVLRFVMEKYNYSYAISHESSTGTQAQIPAAKLFLYGAIQGEDTQLADDRHLSPASAEVLPAADYVGSEGGVDIHPGRSEKKPVNISEVLRNRAISAAGQPSSSGGSGASQKHSLSGKSLSADSTLASDTLDDETMESRLADMTRRASEEVKALAAGLKEAERSLEVQRNNEYGNTEQ